MWAPETSRRIASSDERPVRCASSVTASASPAVRSRLAAVPSIAARLFAPSPCASGIVTSITASDPATATANGDSPERIAGTMKPTMIARPRPSPTSESAPRSRAKRITRSGERERQPQQGVAPLEVGERVGDRAGVGRLGPQDADLVADREVRDGLACEAELHRLRRALVGTAAKLDLGRDARALGGRRTRGLADRGDFGELAVPRRPGHGWPVVARPEHRDRDRGGDRRSRQDPDREPHGRRHQRQASQAPWSTISWSRTSNPAPPVTLVTARSTPASSKGRTLPHSSQTMWWWCSPPGSVRS